MAVSVLAEYLKDVAKKQKTVFYDDVAALLKLNLKNPDDRQTLTSYLNEISTEEDTNNRPLLSAIVVNKKGVNQGFPGKEFGNLGRELGYCHEDGELDDMAFAVEQINAVFAHWKE
ncbi:hypothetical protein [Paenalcaligenes faecalis]|uniref:hypothetical protein n=1 Tax=Paenalcaligenes faecalis TaxID=2980099 RepID=UPI0022B96AF9|nr:hypothetical protein [Paenalcaligenes faecalis]